MSMFHVGQRVVFVGQTAKRRMPSANYPVLNQVYTVRGFVDGTDGDVRILLEEIYNEPMWCVVGLVEWGFNAKYFRPVRETSIEVFTKLLESAPTDLPAEQPEEPRVPILNWGG